MTLDQRRSPRYPFFASAEISEPDTGVHLVSRTSELSLQGCYFDMMNPLWPGCIVKIQILNHNQKFEAKGHVIYSQSNKGMGVIFDEVESQYKLTLEKWLATLAGAGKP